MSAERLVYKTKIDGQKPEMKRKKKVLTGFYPYHIQDPYTTQSLPQHLWRYPPLLLVRFSVKQLQWITPWIKIQTRGRTENLSDMSWSRVKRFNIAGFNFRSKCVPWQDDKCLISRSWKGVKRYFVNFNSTSRQHLHCSRNSLPMHH